MSKTYNLLVNTLDSIIKEAPKENEKYSFETVDLHNQSRTRALIHLYIRTKFGLIDFNNAEMLITDGAFDGGLDGYYIDKDKKIIYLIQSKFKHKANGFEEAQMQYKELFLMELERIIKGHTTDNQGNQYNTSILEFQNKLKEIKDIGMYEKRVVFLGNTPYKLSEDQLHNVCGQIAEKYEIFDAKTIYKEILLPYLQSDYYDEKELTLKIKVSQSQANRIKYGVHVGDKLVTINIFFIPTLEIAKTMHDYKNALLHYNPRCFVGLADGNTNGQIKKSITDEQDNLFALLNNGVTIICNSCGYSDGVGEINTGILNISNPQIVNGGQTAFTLAKILEDSQTDNNNFENKEVLCKIISFENNGDENDLDLIEKISEATNNQTPIKIEDRMSNDPKLVELQNYLFEKYGMLLERKKGEFHNSIEQSIITKSEPIKKEEVLRLSFCGDGRVSEARNFTSNKLFKSYPLEKYDESGFDNLYTLITVYKLLSKFKGPKEDKYNTIKYGNALRYASFAVCGAVYKITDDIYNIQDKLEHVLVKWKDFEDTIMNLETNLDYFGDDERNFDNYYKGKTVNKDLANYFGYQLYDVPNDNDCYYLDYKGCKAKGVYMDGQIRVLKGSTMFGDKDQLIKTSPRYQHMRMDTTKIRFIDGYYTTIEDIVYDNPSTASTVIMGRHSNGWTEWVDKDGVTLDEKERQQ